MSKLTGQIYVVVVYALSLATTAIADTAPDATQANPDTNVATAEYRFPADLDTDVATDRLTEKWARVYWPDPLPGTALPLLVFLHGNHSTCGHGMNPRVDDNCQYTSTGTCPLLAPIVVPNHEGYNYLAQVLASWNYIVVSINTNRGITCGNGIVGDGGLNLMRGRMVLRHLEMLSYWNNNPGTTPPDLGIDLFGQLDFSNVGLLGHSRGGEGMRAAYNYYRDPGSPWPDRIGPVNFLSIFEIGPVDGQTSRVLDSDGTIWSVILPMCDGDVSNLQGIIPFDRDLRHFSESPATQKASYTVWGANHNFFNTEWQVSDSNGCIGHDPIIPQFVGSEAQRTTSLASVVALFRGNVGPNADPTFNQNFNPQYDLPDVVTSVTRIGRGYTDSPSSSVTTVFEDFDRPTGTNTYGFPNDASNITINHGTVPNHAAVQRAGQISWSSADDANYFQSNWASAGSGNDVSAFETLDLRVSRQNSALNPVTPSNFAVALSLDDDTLSQPVNLSSYTDLRGPVGGPGGLHPILQSARVPLADFATDLTRVRGVRLTFNDTPSGAIYVANLRLSTVSGNPPSGPAPAGSVATGYNDIIVPEVISATLRGIRAVASTAALNGDPGYELEIASNGTPFLAQNDLPRLRIGVHEIAAPSRYPNGDTRSIVFSLTREQFAGLASGPASVEYSNKIWNFTL